MATNYNYLLNQNKLKALQGTTNAQPVQVPYDMQSYTDSKRAQAQASNDNSWQKMLQAAAMASMMDNKTALGFGLGSLLFNAWDRWKNRNKKPASNGDGTITLTETTPTIYDPSMPPGYEVTGTEISAGVTPSATLTQRMGIDNFKATNPMDMSTNPANNANYMKENGMATSPWSMSKPSVADMQNNALGGLGDFSTNSDLYRRLFGGGK